MQRRSQYEYPSIATLRELFSLVREDWVTHHSDWREPGFQALLMYRIGLFHRGRPLGDWRAALPRKALFVLYRWLHWRVRHRHGIELHASAHIGRRLFIPHGGTIIFGKFVHVGDDCMIRSGVTLGAANPDWIWGKGPRLGDDVHVGVNSCVLGSVTVGDGCRIGPNVTVFFDVRPGTKIVVHKPRVIEPSDQVVREE